jgi:type III pantothenate kinase
MVERSVSGKLSLLVDVGNSSIKAAYYKNNQFVGDGIERFNEPNQLIDKIKASSHVYLSNVGKTKITELLQTICNDLSRPLFIATSQSLEFGLTNAYNKPKNMGVDRWLAMLACMNRSKEKTFLIVDIGTAMTIDAVINGNHLGGWITPGLELLRQSLFTNTQRVFGVDNKSNKIDFGDDTPVCVNNGCTAQIIGTFLMAQNKMHKKVNKFDIFITGGNKNIITEFNNKKIILCENLVLDGLTLFVD